MTQRIRFYLIKILLLFLLFEPIICLPYEQYNTRQDRSPFFDTNPFFNMNYGDTTSRRNFEYQPYQPYFVRPQLQQPQYQQQHRKYRDETYLQPRSGVAQVPEYNVQERSSSAVPARQPTLRPISIPIPYQGKPYGSMDMDLEDKIRSIFYVGPETDFKLLNTTLDSNLSSLDRMHADESHNSSDENATDLSSNQSSSSSTMATAIASTSASVSSMPKPESSSSISTSTNMKNEEPTFKVQRTPDGKLSLVFNDILSLQRPTVTQTKKPPVVYRRPDIIFPTTTSTYTTSSRTSFNRCDSYEGQSLCKKVSDYPDLKQFDSVLQREFAQLGVYFAADIEQTFNITQRFGDDPAETDLCDSEKTTIFPEAGETWDQRWLFIVNDKNAYKQGVRVEKCTGQEKPCKIIDENLPINYRSVCKQSYSYRMLIAIAENGTVTKEQFKIPSCCKCVLRNSISRV